MKTFSCAKASRRAVFVTHVTTRRFGLFINNEESVSSVSCVRTLCIEFFYCIGEKDAFNTFHSLFLAL